MMSLPKQTAERTFLNDCIQLYEEMKVALKTYKKRQVSEEDKIQNCFEIAGIYKIRVNESVWNHQFNNKEEEIFFFKKVKPLFSAEVEFYTYLYHIVLFKTKEIESDKFELEQFYKRQLQKRDKFRKEEPEFYNYVEHNCTDADLQWFTRTSESRDSSLFDGLMGRYLAIEKFELYLKNKINTEFNYLDNEPFED